jgi:PAS domain S-box-containing protein
MLRLLSNKQATIYAIIAFVLTLALTYFLPDYTITLSGLLVVIFLSVFVDDIQSTLAASTLCILVVAVYYFLHQNENISAARSIIEHLFIIFLILFTTLLVLYMKRMNQAMNFEKSHMTALFENATEGIILTNQTGQIILVNPAAEKMFAYATGELIGHAIEILIPKNIREAHVKLRDTFYVGPSHRAMGSGRDLYGQKKTGERLPVEVSLSYYKRGNQLFAIAFIVDITHRKQIEENMRLQQQQLEQVTNEIRSLNSELEMKVEERTLILKEALQKLEESQSELSEALDKERQLNEIKSRFVSMASHEFRTPLSTVLSSASLLAKYTKAEDQERRDKHINRIKDAVKNLNDILEDFLSLGKLDEGKVAAIPTPFDIKDFIEETIDDVKGLLKNGQNINYRHDGPTIVNSDKKLLKNILLNLTSNAIKFSNENSDVNIYSKVEAGEAVVSVEDKGIGISQEDQQHLFSSFFRGKNAINIQGTGLGLHIVKRYLDLLGGDLQMKSVLNEGTTITINIPVNLVNSQAHVKENIGN